MDRTIHLSLISVLTVPFQMFGDICIEKIAYDTMKANILERR